jgi:hypothetical protein
VRAYTGGPRVSSAYATAVLPGLLLVGFGAGLSFNAMTTAALARVGDAAVDVEDLAVDPARGAGQERYRLGDVVGRAEPLGRRHAGEVADRLLVLAGEEQRRGGRAGRHRVVVRSASTSITRGPRLPGFDA